jgi:AcrR family transcriptional regulator
VSDEFLARWDRLEAAYLGRMEAVTAPCEEWRERFRAAAKETARLVEEHPAEARFLAVDTLAAGELGRRRQGVLAARLAEMLDSARDELPDPDRIPEATAGWIVAIFFDRVYRRCAGFGIPDLPSQLPELMFLAISAYFGTEAGLEELVQPP